MPGHLAGHVQIKGFEELQHNLKIGLVQMEANMKKVLREAANEIRRQERARTASKTVRRRIKVKLITHGGNPAALVSPGTPAQFEESGARRHAIYSRHGGFLAFPKEGRRKGKGKKGKNDSAMVIVSSVNHPGRKARPFVQESLHAAMPKIDAFAQEVVEKLAERIAKKGKGHE